MIKEIITSDTVPGGRSDYRKGLSRRSMLNTAAVGAASLTLTACTGLFSTTTVNGVTTVVVNTAQLNTDGQAVITAAKSLLANPLLADALGANLTVANLALTTASATMASIATATNGVVTTSIDTTSVQNLVKSLIADISQIVTIVNAVIPQLASSAASTVAGYLSAINGLIPFVQLAVALATPASATLVAKMPEAQALYIATH